MSGAAGRPAMLLYLLMMSGIVATIIIAVVMMRSIRSASLPAALGAPERGTGAIVTLQPAARPGVTATITAGGVTITRTLPALAFALSPEQSLDPRLPAGPFEAELRVTFLTGNVREAYVGAEFQGGSLIILRAGEPPLLSDYSGDKPRLAETRQSVSFSRRPQTLTYIFKSEGGKAARLQAMWRPIESQVALPLPSEGGPLLDRPAVRGFALAQEFNCTACHASADPQLHAQLAVNAAPLLGNIGARARPEWIRRALEDPQWHRTAGSAMPRILRGAGRAEQIEDLTHFLVSMGGPIDEGAASAPDHDLIATGMIAYHTVGCFACHGPLEPTERLPGGLRSATQVRRQYTPLGRLAAKMSVDDLAEFLVDPLKHRPSGSMPSLSLSALEAKAIASYLVSRERDVATSQDYEFPPSLDALRVDSGRSLFASTGCANCHALGPDRTPIEPLLIAPTLESLRADGPHGCLAPEPIEGTPQFTLDGSQRAALLAFLRELPSRRANNSPHDLLAATMHRLNCAACHQYHGERGPEAGVSQYFTTIAEADLGDEGRLPPDLSHVGAKLNPGCMREVLEDKGRMRPWMGARMPEFGAANVAQLPDQFAGAAGVPSEPDHGAVPAEWASIGRELVGSKAFNCIQCHMIAGRDATGTPGPDLALMPERLRYAAFARWIHDPKLVRPGTRMPSFFIAGRSAFLDLLEGDAEKQVQALWAYLSQGEFLAPPEGLIDPARLQLQVGAEPVILRTFIKEAGVRAIAVGYPEQIHIAFDAEKCRLAVVWQGAFLNASGAWAARGGEETNPDKVKWTAPDDPVVTLAVDGVLQTPTSLRFRGYRLDWERRPIFMYVAAFESAILQISEQPIPGRENNEAKLIRRFTIEGSPGRVVEIGGRKTRIDDNGWARVEVEITW